MTQISYVLVGVAGYIEAPDSTSGNLLNNYCVSPGWMHTNHNSAMMLPAYAAMALSVVMAYPLNIHPCAEQHRPPLTISPSHHTSLSPPHHPHHPPLSPLTTRHSLPFLHTHTHSCRYTLDIFAPVVSAFIVLATLRVLDAETTLGIAVAFAGLVTCLFVLPACLLFYHRRVSRNRIGRAP